MKRVIALTLVAFLMISILSACGNNTGSAQGDTQNGSGATGRYIENEIVLPEEGRILDIQGLDDGSIGALLSNSEEIMTLWNSNDAGATWERSYDVPLDAAKSEYVANAAIFGDKTLMCIVYSTDVSASTMGGQYWRVEANGDKSEIQIDLPETQLSEGVTKGQSVVIEAGNEDAENVTDSESAEELVDSEMPEDVIDSEILDGVIDSETLEELIGGEGSDVIDGEAIINQEGTIASARVSEDDTSGQFIIEENGMQGDMQDAIWGVKVGANKELLAQTLMGHLYQIDVESGEILQEYQIGEEEYISGFGMANGDVYIETGMGLKRYDMGSGDSKEIAKALLEKVVSDASSTDVMYMQSGLAIAAKAGEADAIYVVDNTGIYRQSEDGTVLEQVVDGNLASFSMPSTAIHKMLALEDNSFVVSADNPNGEGVLYHYTYSAEAKTVPEKELSIYALADNREIRQAIAMYQKVNPDVMVSLQVGMTGEEGITVSDALSTLNTEIMAGNGPDILLLDGMPTDSYIERGILEDISDIANKIDSEDGLLESIKNDYAIASRFSVPYIQGAEEYIDQIKDIDTLSEVLSEIKKENPNANTLSGMLVEELMNYLYRINVNNFITADGELEKAKMQNFLDKAKVIADDNRAREHEVGDMEGLSTTVIGMAMAEGYSAMEVALDLLSAPRIIGRGEIRSMSDLAIVLEMDKKENIKHSLITNDAGDRLLLTNTVLGINSKSERLEEAKEFVAFCLSKEGQKSGQGMGFPVNKTALNEMLYEEVQETVFAIGTQGEDGVMTTVELTVTQPEKATIENFENDILGDAKLGYSNRIVQEIIMEQLMGYVEGRMTLEEATQGIDQKVSLYLAE